ncbi:MAG: M20/M25/M40 family metallo-hydrolase [Acholeplasmatales bacterium]|nr:M20/M25/M40 family metallo-hydrolase [Acholeplasmatales bacterium]
MVNKERMKKEFEKLISFDSESFHEREIYNYLKNKLIELGLDVKTDNVSSKFDSNDGGNNIYGFLKGNVEGESILLSSHMDTVKPGIGKKVVYHDDGKVTSDGNSVLGSDDVTGIVEILEALYQIKENNLKHPDIEVVFFVAEEPFCVGSRYFDYSLIKSKYAYVFDLSGEIGTIAISAPTILSFDINVIGKSAHAGFEPEKGISAIAIAAKGISNLKLGRINEYTTLNIGLISGGTVRNAIPDNVILKGEIRSSIHEKALETLDYVITIFDYVSKEYGGLIKYNSEENIHAYKVSSDSILIKNYQKALDKLGYGKCNIIDTFGGSDNNNLNKNGIEGVVLSSAMNNVHTKEEYFYLEEFYKAAEIAIKLVTLDI